jgi:hypothetical protein
MRQNGKSEIFPIHFEQVTQTRQGAVVKSTCFQAFTKEKIVFTKKI